MHIALTEQSVGTFDSGVATITVFESCLASDLVVARARKSTRCKQETVIERNTRVLMLFETCSECLGVVR